MDNEGLFKSIAKFSVEVEDAANVPEVITDAFREAVSSRFRSIFCQLARQDSNG